jgi:hypothetical protein
VQPDDGLMGGLVRRVELQPAARVPGRALQLAERELTRLDEAITIYDSEESALNGVVR